MMNHRTEKYAPLMAALGLVGAVAGCGEDTDELPAFDSLEATYQAVDEVVDCSDDAPEPAGKRTALGGPTGEAVMCTSTVEVLWFDDDGAEVMVGAVPERSTDIEQLADALGARYTVER